MRIAIVGGGPAGAFLAHRLGAAGIACTLFEKNGAWEKPCGGGVPPKVSDRFPEIADYPGPKNEVTIGKFVSPGGVGVELDSGRAMWIIARKDLNGHLLQLARSHKNVEYFKEAVRSVKAEGNQFVLATSKRTETFDFLVGADGCFSKVREATCGPIPRTLITVCSGWFVEGTSDTALSRLLPAPGYLWAFPRTDHICVGGGSADPHLAMKVYAADFLGRDYPESKRLKKWAAPIPFIRDRSFYDQPACGENWAVIGDAAGHVDAITGEGIYYAMADAEHLAAALIQGDPTRFDRLWREDYGDQLRTATKLSRHFYQPKKTEKIFRMASRSKTLKAFLMEVLTEQPAYDLAGKKFRSLMPKIFWESFWNLG
jgi:geranylgeranyl diphosphate/geranylgeranyl-bacteriochlorophyllide a reductase